MVPNPGPDSWKQVFINEVKGQISQADWQRVHFLADWVIRCS